MMFSGNYIAASVVLHRSLSCKSHETVGVMQQPLVHRVLQSVLGCLQRCLCGGDNQAPSHLEQIRPG